jgi:transposase-like protein
MFAGTVGTASRRPWPVIERLADLAMDVPRFPVHPFTMNSAHLFQRLSATEFPIRLFRRLRFGSGLFCPRCGHKRVHRWGSYGWRRRYRCLGCRRTFSDFTGTPLAYLKRVELWPRFCSLILEVTTVRCAARRLGLHKSTSFRWRHLLLTALLDTESVRLQGRISVDAAWFPYSEKGARTLSRPPRRSAFQGLSFQADRPVWLLFACAESGESMATRIGASPPSFGSMHGALAGRIHVPATLLAQAGRAGLVGRVASHLDLSFEAESARAVREWTERPEPARAQVLRLKRWMIRFHGVATKYLENYLVWFRLLDLAVGRWTRTRPLDRLLLGAFP